MIKASRKVNLQYWTKYDKVRNLGDYLGEVLLKFANIGVCDSGSLVYLSVGTSLSSYWWQSCRGNKVVWGSGSCGFDLPKISESDLILAVRGPLTAKWLGLPESTPLGDPALLLPRLYKPKDMNCGPLLVENFHSDIDVPATKINVVKKISMKVFDDNWRVVVDKIYSSDFVLANSLHSAIIAQAYGRPWAFYLDNKSKQPLPLRWKDWFSFLGLPEDALTPVDSLIGAIKWWDENNQKIKAPDIKGLIECCPWSALRRILK